MNFWETLTGFEKIQLIALLVGGAFAVKYLTAFVIIFFHVIGG